MATGSNKKSKNDSLFSFFIVVAIFGVWIATHRDQTPAPEVKHPVIAVAARDTPKGSGAGTFAEREANSSGNSDHERRRSRSEDGSNITGGHYTAGVPEQMPVPTTPTYVPVYTPPTPIYTAPTPVEVPSVPVSEPIEVHPF